MRIIVNDVAITGQVRHVAQSVQGASLQSISTYVGRAQLHNVEIVHADSEIDAVSKISKILAILGYTSLPAVQT